MSTGASAPEAKSPHAAMVVAVQPLERQRIARHLRRVFAQVILVRDPYEAVARASDDRIHLVVVSLEGLTSADRKFLDPVRRSCLDVRTLLLVPEGKRRVARAFLESGADAMLSAPHDDVELRCLVRSMVRSDGPDPLTGLPNRAAGERAVQLEIARAAREGRSLGYAILDLDGFGEINATWGFRGGDSVLAGATAVLRRAFRITDGVYRWGGDEFLVLLPGLPADVEAARDAACQKLQAIARALASSDLPLGSHPGRSLRVTLKGGLAICPGESKEPLTLFDTANWRLRQAAKLGGNRIVCIDGICPHTTEGSRS